MQSNANVLFTFLIVLASAFSLLLPVSEIIRTEQGHNRFQELLVYQDRLVGRELLREQRVQVRPLLASLAFVVETFQLDSQRCEPSKGCSCLQHPLVAPWGYRHIAAAKLPFLDHEDLCGVDRYFGTQDSELSAEQYESALHCRHVPLERFMVLLVEWNRGHDLEVGVVPVQTEQQN